MQNKVPGKGYEIIIYTEIAMNMECLFSMCQHFKKSLLTIE